MSPLGQLAYSLAWMFAVPTLALLAGFAPVSRKRLTTFALQHDITVTPGNGRILIGYLTRVARWRALGGAAGWIAGGALDLPGAYYFWGPAGYLTGALVAEIRTSVRPAPPGGLRRAALSVRRSGDYLSWGARWGPALIVTALGCQISGYLLWPSAEHPDVHAARMILPIVAIAAMATVQWLSRWLIIRRPQPVLAGDLGAADDAIRATSLQAIGGASLALMCLAATDVMWAVMPALDAPGPFDWIFPTLTFGMSLSTIYAWFGLRVRVRRSRRVTA